MTVSAISRRSKNLSFAGSAIYRIVSVLSILEMIFASVYREKFDYRGFEFIYSIVGIIIIPFFLTFWNGTILDDLSRLERLE